MTAGPQQRLFWSPLAPVAAAGWPQPERGVAGVREPCRRDSPESGSAEGSGTARCETDVGQKCFRPLPLLEHSHFACLVF